MKHLETMTILAAAVLGFVTLACPPMMMWMMGRGSGREDETTSPANGAGGSDGSSSSTDETAALKQRVAGLESERDPVPEEAGG